MNFFILRNSTIESLFGFNNVTYSGYSDISYVDQSADIIFWFYLLPFKTDSNVLVNEINSYFNSIELIYKQIQHHKTFIIFTLTYPFDFKFQNSDFSVNSAIAKFNQDIIDLAREHSNIKIIEFGEFTNKYANEQIIDWKYYFISKMQINPKLAPAFRIWVARKIEEIQLKRKKCLVLDLDNTLWGGILGEDGIDGIKIGGDYPGNAFQMFQEYLIELGRNGIILTVCSKNNELDVLEAWNLNPFMVLKKEHLSAYRINWQNKVDNIIELSKELNIGLDSFVFLDDNPAERELVKQMLPMVEVPDFPNQPYMLPTLAMSLLDNFFRIYSITNEDRQKTEQYHLNSERIKDQGKFTDFTEYLMSLKIKLAIENVNTFNLSRIAQMTQKTNQFNLTTRRYTEPEIQGFVDKGSLIYCLNASDRFGDNGITGLIIIHLDNVFSTALIDSFLLSCRILGKGIEKAFIFAVLKKLKSKGFKKVQSTFLPSLKNKQVSNFYDSINFELLNSELSGGESKNYIIDLDLHDFNIEPYYKIEEF